MDFQPEAAFVGSPAIRKCLAIQETASRLALLPLEDVLALEDQPNLPGTTVEQPNWRRRYSGEAGQLLEQPGVRQRLQPLTGRRDP